MTRIANTTCIAKSEFFAKCSLILWTLYVFFHVQYPTNGCDDVGGDPLLFDEEVLCLLDDDVLVVGVDGAFFLGVDLVDDVMLVGDAGKSSSNRL